MKRSLIAVIAVLAVTSILAGVFLSRDGNSETTIPNKENQVGAGTIQIPDGPKIKVVLVDFPKELELKWEKLEVQYGIQLFLEGTLKNISSQTVNLDEITFSLNGIFADRYYAMTLEPGKEKKFVTGGIWSSETKTQMLEVKIVGFKKVEAPTSTTSPAPETPKPTSQEPTEKIFTEVPKSPKTPSEIISAFYFFANQEKWDKAAELCYDATSNEFKVPLKDRVFKGRQLQKVITREERIYNDKATWDGTLYFTDGTSHSISGAGLRKKGSEWKVYD